jgi:hypothetical protein
MRETLVEMATRVMTARAVQVAWPSAGFSLLLATSLVMRARRARVVTDQSG